MNNLKPQSPPAGEPAIFKLMPDDVSLSPELPILLTSKQYEALSAYILAQVKDLINENVAYPELKNMVDVNALLATAQARFGAEEGKDDA